MKRSIRHTGRRMLRRLRSIAHYGEGFTLVELLIVVTIIGVIVTLAMPVFSHFKTVAKMARASAEIRQLEQAISGFAAEKGYFPPQLSDIAQAPALLDPWGRNYEYLIVQGHEASQRQDLALEPLNGDYDLYSRGFDGLTSRVISDPGGDDDIIRAADGVYVGSVKKFLETL